MQARSYMVGAAEKQLPLSKFVLVPYKNLTNTTLVAIMLRYAYICIVTQGAAPQIC